MGTEYLTVRKLVRQDFQILLRAEVEIPIPEGYSEIRRFYETVTDTLLRWATERMGERFREEYLAADVRERARYKTKVFRVLGEALPIEQEWFAMICRARQTWDPASESVSTLQVWNLLEQTLLPSKEIISRFPDAEFRKFFTKCEKSGKVGKKHLKKKKEYAIINQ